MCDGTSVELAENISVRYGYFQMLGLFILTNIISIDDNICNTVFISPTTGIKLTITVYVNV